VKRLLVGILTVAVVGGCGSREQSASAPTGSTSQSARELPAGSERPLDAGKYTFSAFEPGLTFSVGQGWETGHQHDDFFDVWRGRTTAIGWARPEFVAGPEGRLEAEGLTAEEAIQALSSNPSVVDAGEPEPATIDGAPGSSLEFSTKLGGELFGSSEGAFGTSERSARFRLTAVTVDGELVLMLEVSLHDPHGDSFSRTSKVARTVRLA
jgi:hypothetical protein